MKHPVLTSSVITAVLLVGGMIAGVAIGSLVIGLPFHAPEQTAALLASIPVFGGGAIWAFLLVRIHNLSHRMRTSLAGALGFGLAVISAAFLLNVLEKALVEENRLPDVPIHVKFTLLFVPATFLVVTIGGSAILLASGNRANWLRSALAAGVAASLSFLTVDLVLDTLGWRIGAPHAAERATMLTVAFLGSVAAALSGGAILGRLLSKGAGHTPSAAQHGVQA